MYNSSFNTHWRFQLAPTCVLPPAKTVKLKLTVFAEIISFWVMALLWCHQCGKYSVSK